MSAIIAKSSDPPAGPVPVPARVIRVAHVHNVYDGIETTLGPKIFALARYDDLDVTIVAPSDGKRKTAKLPIRHIPADIPRTIRPWADLRSALRLARIFRRERFDIVHTHTAKAGAIGAFAAWLARVPLIYHTYHGLPFYDGQPRRQYRLYRFLEWFACRMRRHVFSQNRHDLAACRQLIRDPGRVHFEGNGVVVEDIRAAAERGRVAGEAWYRRPGTRLVLVARLEPVKRIGDFIRCVEQLTGEGIDLCCVVAGDGFQRAELQARIEDAGLQDIVLLGGYILEVHALIAACDIAVLTSEKEGIPRALMEAMALGKPAVATDVLGTQELVVDGVTGYLTPLGDIPAMAGRIRELVENPELRESFGRAGRERIEQQFSDHRIAERLHGFYLREFASLNATTARR